MTRRFASFARGLAAVAFAAGMGACLSVPTGAATMCSTDSDCDQSTGEVCSEGVCYGDPPTGMFAATLGAPTTRSDLVAVELPQLALADDGDLGNLALGSPATLMGFVELQDRSPVDATITISRPSLFAGGPGFHAVVTSTAGAFTAEVPPTGASDPPYTITIVPNGRGDTPPTTPSDAELAPPYYTSLAVPSATTMPTVTLDDPSLPIITGGVVDANQNALQHYRVSAFGRWDASQTATEVSSVAYTGSDGTFSIELAANLLPGVELVAAPYDTAAPTLMFASATPPSTHTFVQPAGLGGAVELVVPVEGVDSGGTVSPVVGAHVTITGSASATALGATTTATLTADDTTDVSGNAHLTIVPGGDLGASYTLRIVPPASSNLGIVFDEPLTATVSETLATHRLASRVAISGTVVDTSGNPLANVSVTVQPSLKFLWDLADEPQAFLAEIPPPTTVTPATGDFVLWVDPIVAGVWSDYDLAFEPAVGSDVPNWTVGDVEVPRQAGNGNLALGNVTIPDPAYIHGGITDSLGNVVPGGVLQIFELQTTSNLCTSSTNPPATACAVPAIVRGSGTADGDGKVRLTLPRPQ